MKKLFVSVLLAASLLAGNTVFAKGKGNDPAKKEQKVQKQGDRLEKLKTELGLREDQVPQVKQAIEEHRNAIKAIHAENLEKQVQKDKIKAANQAFQTKMKSILNEAQYNKFQQMVKDGKKAKKHENKGKHKGQKKSE